MTMITPCTYDFVIYRGTTLRKTFTWKPGNVLANLSGYSATVQFRLATVDPSPALTLTSQNGGVVLGGALGTFEMFATPTQMLVLTADAYLYEMRIIYPNTDIASLVKGKMTLITWAAR